MITIDGVEQNPAESLPLNEQFSWLDMAQLTQETLDDIITAIGQRQNILFAGPDASTLREIIEKYARHLLKDRPDELIGILEREGHDRMNLDAGPRVEETANHMDLGELLAKVNERRSTCLLMLDALRPDTVPLFKLWASLGGGLATFVCERYEDVLPTLGRYIANAEGLSDELGSKEADKCVDVLIFVQPMLARSGERAHFKSPPIDRPLRAVRHARATEPARALPPDATKMFVAYDALTDRPVACGKDAAGERDTVGQALATWARDGLQIRYQNERDISLNIKRYPAVSKRARRKRYAA